MVLYNCCSLVLPVKAVALGEAAPQDLFPSPCRSINIEASSARGDRPWPRRTSSGQFRVATRTGAEAIQSAISITAIREVLLPRPEITLQYGKPGKIITIALGGWEGELKWRSKPVSEKRSEIEPTSAKPSFREAGSMLHLAGFKLHRTTIGYIVMSNC